MTQKKMYLYVGIVLLLLLCSCGLHPYDRDLADRQYQFAAEMLDAYFIFRDRLPEDLYRFSSPEALYESVNERFTFYENHEDAKWRYGFLTTEGYGVGISLDSVGRGYLIKDVFPGSPGDSAGLEPLDTIIAVNGISVKGMTVDEFLSFVRGENGTDVLLRIRRGADYKNITVTRGPYRAPSVYVETIDSTIALITLTSFFQETTLPGGSAEEFSAALDKTTAASATIIDLRHNGGGLVEQCRAIVGELVPNDTPIVRTKIRTIDEEGKSVEVDSTFLAAGTARAADRTMYILVDSLTASASEILVACLMQRPKVTVVGGRTYGKGRGQVFAWGPDSVYAQVTCMTISPAGSDAVEYDSVGIDPDVEADVSKALDVALGLIDSTGLAKRLLGAGYRGAILSDVPVYCTEPTALFTIGRHHD